MEWQELEALHNALERVRELIDTAPERFESTGGGYLAESDWDAVLSAGRVVHRLMLWRKFPQVSPESYLPGAGADDDLAGELGLEPVTEDELGALLPGAGPTENAAPE